MMRFKAGFPAFRFLIRAGVLAALLVAGPAQAAGRFEIVLKAESKAALKPAEQDAVNRFFADAAARLPEKLKVGLDRRIEVELHDFTAEEAEQGETASRPRELPTPVCPGTQDSGSEPLIPEKRILGRALKPFWFPTYAHEILLNRLFLPEILKGESGSRQFPCGHRNMYRMAVATLLHEIVHLYDFANLQPAEVRAEMERCNRVSPSRRERDWSCRKYAGLDRTLSKNPVIETLLGSVEIGSFLPTRRDGEVTSLRSPDPYEFKNTEEGLAVNLEYFLMDPEYACRRPTLHHVFAKHFGFDPFPLRPCALNTVVPLSTSNLGDSVLRFLDLNPLRLYQVHFLFASQGQLLMSRWGHSMFRLVFCAPERKEVGPDCLKDVSYHVVVSFRANVSNDVRISNIKGLTGQYPSQLYLLSLVEVMQQYTVDELRNLISLPLKLSPEEMQQFLARSIEMSWEYQGRYLFISNNCATEAVNLIKAVIPWDSDFQLATVLSPLGLYDKLIYYGLMDDAPLQDEKKAIAEGYLFPSERPRLERAFDGITNVDPDGKLAFDDLDDYLTGSEAPQRLAWFEQLMSQVPTAERTRLAARFFLLENYLVRIKQSEFLEKVSGALSEGSVGSADPDGKIAQAMARARALQSALTPVGLLQSGYGVPTAADYRSSFKEDAESMRSELLKLMSGMSDFLKTSFPNEYREVTQTYENRKAMAQRIRGGFSAQLPTQ